MIGGVRAIASSLAAFCNRTGIPEQYSTCSGIPSSCDQRKGGGRSCYAHLTQTVRRVKEVLGDEVKISLIVSQDKIGENLDWDGTLLLDPARVLHVRYGAASPSLYFVRPDGYIGFRCQPVQEKPLLDYLEQRFGWSITAKRR